MSEHPGPYPRPSENRTEPYRAPIAMSDDDDHDLYPPAVARPPAASYYDEPTPRETALRFIAGAFALVVALWALAYTGEQITSPTVALPTHERVVEAITDMRGLLVLHEETLRTDARQAIDPSEPVDIPGLYMHDIVLSAAEIDGRSIDQWHDTLSTRAATATYRDGLGVFHEERAVPDNSIFSATNASDRVLTFTSQSRHDQFSSVTEPLLLASAVLAALVLLVGPGLQRFSALGIAVAIAAIPLALIGLFAYVLILLVGGDGTHVASELSSIIRGLARAPLQNALWLVVIGLALLVPAMLAGRLLRREPEPAVERDEFHVDEHEPA